MVYKKAVGSILVISFHIEEEAAFILSVQFWTNPYVSLLR